MLQTIHSDTAAWHAMAAKGDGVPLRIGNDPAEMPGQEDDYQSYGVPWANASNTPFRMYKHWVHEGGIATPFIAHWPAAIPGGQQTLWADAKPPKLDKMGGTTFATKTAKVKAEVRQIADRVTVLKDGRHVATSRAPPPCWPTRNAR